MTTASESWLDDIFDAVVSDVQRSGYFDKVNEHEPKRKPGHGLTAAVWIDRITALPAASGLAATSCALVFIVRIYQSAFAEPADRMDRELIRATSNLLRRYHDDFDFEGVIRNVDLLGGHTGQPLGAQAGYIEMDGKLYRTMDLMVPCIVNDVWPQVN